MKNEPETRNKKGAQRREVEMREKSKIEKTVRWALSSRDCRPWKILAGYSQDEAQEALEAANRLFGSRLYGWVWDELYKFLGIQAETIVR